MSTLPDKLAAITAATRVFEQNSLPYALIGGLAVGLHSGVPRATLDVDFAVRSSVDRSTLTRVMTQGGFILKGDFPHSINFQHASGEPVQIAFDPSFDSMVLRAESLNIEGISLRIVTKDDLLSMKRMAAADPRRRRSKALRDQADIALLEGDVPDPHEGW
jgi:hypothetical protein